MTIQPTKKGNIMRGYSGPVALKKTAVYYIHHITDLTEVHRGSAIAAAMAQIQMEETNAQKI